MAHITDILAPRFTGHVGPVRFVRGNAETDDPDMVDYFRADPDRYAVTEWYPFGWKPTFFGAAFFARALLRAGLRFMCPPVRAAILARAACHETETCAP